MTNLSTEHCRGTWCGSLFRVEEARLSTKNYKLINPVITNYPSRNSGKARKSSCESLASCSSETRLWEVYVQISTLECITYEALLRWMLPSIRFLLTSSSIHPYNLSTILSMLRLDIATKLAPWHKQHTVYWFKDAAEHGEVFATDLHLQCCFLPLCR